MSRNLDTIASHRSALPRHARIDMPSNAVKRYSFYRLGFRANVIEPLKWSDSFRIDTPDGSFLMTKAEFYRVFPNVVKSESYQVKGLYHYPTTPQKALQFLR
jgi:hypothetical protein